MAEAYPYSDSMSPREATHVTGVVDGVDTSWWVYASAPGAPTIVMVHGFRGDHHGLQLFADALPEYRVVIPDLPAFGASSSWAKEDITADDYGRWLNEFLKDTSTTGAAVLGHSFGSIVVANALRGPRTAPVILVNPISQRALTGPKRFLTAIASSWYVLGGLLPHKMGNALLSWQFVVRVMSGLLVKSKDPHLRRWIHDQHAQYFSRYSDRESLIRAYNVSISHDVSQYAAEITAPVLLVTADEDDITPMSAQEHVNAILSDSTLVVIHGVGHLVHYEKPIETASAIRAFLAKR